MKVNSETILFLNSLNPWWKKKSFRNKVKRREFYEHLLNPNEDDRLIRVLIGARRVEKTSILLSKINQLLQFVYYL